MPVVTFPSDLASQVNKFIGKFVQTTTRQREEGSSTDDIERYQGMLRFDPITRFCTELVHLYCYALLGEFKHPRKAIQKEIRSALTSNKGSWFKTFKFLTSCAWYGYSWTEAAFLDLPNGRKSLKALRTLNPALYDFAGVPGELQWIKYRGNTSGEKAIDLDYNTGIHLVIGDDISFDEVYGCGRLEAAIPYWDLHQLLMPVLAVAAQRQATPILVKETETGDFVDDINMTNGQPILDDEGNVRQIQKGWDSLQQLVAMANGGVAVHDRDDKIYSVEQEISDEFLMSLAKFAEQYRMLACLVPATTFAITNTGVGDSGLAQQHFNVFQAVNKGFVSYVAEEIIDQLIRPLIIYNYGDIGIYGEFPILLKTQNAERIGELITDAIYKGAFTKSDFVAVNKLRESLEIPQLSEEEFQTLFAASEQTRAESGNLGTSSAIASEEL